MATQEVSRQKRFLPFKTSYRLYVAHNAKNLDLALQHKRMLRVGGGVLTSLAGIFLASHVGISGGITVLVMAVLVTLVLLPRVLWAAGLVVCIIAAYFLPAVGQVAGLAFGVWGSIMALALGHFYLEVKKHPGKIGL
jgi:hypothetical protein